MYPLFQSHIELAHQYWEELILMGDIIIDATCGNGQDTLFLAKQNITDDAGILYAMDIQDQAIESSKGLLKESLPPELFDRVKFIKGCHSQFPSEIEAGSVSLVVYNLGYLPGGDKGLTTLRDTTLLSIKNAFPLLKKGGAISITCYPGHAEGKVEEDALLQFTSGLDPREWSCTHHQWINRKKAPSLLLLQKSR